MKQVVPGLFDLDEIGEIVHCYLWRWSGGVTLFDCGTPSHADRIQRALVANGYPLHSLKRILLTHGDVDHMGSAAALKRATAARIACHTVEKSIVEDPATRPVTSAWMRPVLAMARLVPALRAEPVTPDELLVDGQELEEGFTVVHTPGHTPGHVSYLHREQRILIAGDCLQNYGGKLAIPSPARTPDMKNAERSVWKLAKKYGDEIDVIVFGHGDPILNHGGARLKSLVSQIFALET